MDRADKLDALRQIGMTVQDDGATIPVLAFLSGRLDDVHFVSDLEGARVGVHFSLQTRLWPRIPFRATIDDTTLHNALAFIERMAVRDDDIYVRVNFPGSQIPAWYERVAEDSVQDPRHYLEASMDRMRDQIDFSLDVYRTANEEFDEADDEHRAYLRFALEKARLDIRALNARLAELETHMSHKGP